MKSLPEAFVIATAEDVNLAVAKAQLAWREYRKFSGERRSEFLKLIAKGIEDMGDTLVSRIMLETGYPEARVMVERNRTCAQLRMFANGAISGSWQIPLVEAAIPGRTPAPKPNLKRQMFPLGPVVVFGASNFPLAYSTAGGDVASALAAGCPVIVKAHDSHLGTNALVAEVIMNAAKETDMPDGVFSSLHGDGFETGKQLVLHPYTAAVGFTGSKAGGRALFDVGQQRDIPIPVFAEMGSVNPVFILPAKVKQDVHLLAGQLTSSVTMSGGQFCTKPGLLVALKNPDTDQLITALQENLEKIAASTLLNEGISKSFHHGVSTVQQMKGVQMLQSSSNPDENKAMPIIATIGGDEFLNNAQLHQEIFGPYSLVVICEHLEEMVAVAEALEGQLTATIQASIEDEAVVLQLVEVLIEKAGRIIYNGVPTGVEVSAAMTHGGPYPASTDSRFTAVGSHAIWRWLRPVTFQGWPVTEY